MKRVKKMTRTLVLAALLAVMLATAAMAAGDGSVWLNTTETDQNTAALVVTDTTVTDGIVELTYDSSALTYQGVAVTEGYVAMYAVNADEEGVVKISWVAPEAYQTDGSGISLIQVNFAGTEEESSLALSAVAHDAEGAEVALGTAPDTTDLEKAILEAEGLQEKLYTEESFAAVKEALAEAKAVLADSAATQETIDAAAQALRASMDALVLNGTGSKPDTSVNTSELEKAIAVAEGLNENKYTEKTWTAVEEALKAAKAVLADKDATQAEVDAAVKALKDAVAALELVTGKTPDTGDETNLAMPVILAVVAVIGIAAVLTVNVVSKRRQAR